MFNFIRKHQRLMQLVLLVLILPSFVLIGVSGYTNYVSGDEDLVTVGDQAVTAQEYDLARRNQLNQLQRSMGGGFDPALVDTPAAKQQLLDSLVDRRALIEIATKDRFSVSDTALRQAIAANPDLQENGVFSPELYNMLLAQQGINSKDFEQSQRAELALSRVISPVVQSATLPDFVMKELENVLVETRLVQTHTIRAQDLLDQQTVSDEEIQTWYQANQDSLRLPDYVNVDYVLLNEEAAVKSVAEVKEDDLKAYYEQNKTRFVSPARIHLSHILLQPGKDNAQHQSVQQQAKELAQQAQANPAQFAELAKEHSQDKGSANSGGELGWITHGNWPAALQDAVFALKKGEVSGVIEGPDGYHIFKANDYQPQQGQAFDAVKDEITTEVRQQLAAENFAEMATKLTHMVYESPESLQAAADALGLPVLKAQGVAREQVLDAKQLGATASEHEDLLEDPRVRRALYAPQSLQDKQNAGVIEIASDTIVAVRVNEFVPAHVPELTQVHDEVEKMLRQEKAVAAAQSAGQALLASLQAGETPEVEFSNEQAVSRIQPEQMPKASLDALMAVDTSQLPAYVGVELDQGYQLVKVIGQEKGELDPLISEAIHAQLQQIWSDVQERSYMAALREQLNVKQLPAAETAMATEID